MKILITGVCGPTAIAIVEALHQSGHELVGFDLPEAVCPEQTLNRLQRMINGNIAHFEDIEKAVHGAQAIIHLAIARGEKIYNHPEQPFSINVLGTYNLFEAARCHGITRIVPMSSAAVHVPLHKNEHLSALTDWKSHRDENPLYDLTKRLQEEIAREFCATYQMSVVVLRAGHIVDGRQNTDLKGRQLERLGYCRGGWICRYDLAQACVKAVTLENLGYTSFHVVGSIQARVHFDMDRTERELGLICQYKFEQYT